MSASGFVLGTAVYIFGVKKYHPVVKNAILIGFLGYFFAVTFPAHRPGTTLAASLPHVRFVRYSLRPLPGGLACGPLPFVPAPRIFSVDF